MKERVRVEVGRPYDVVVGSGLLSDARALIAEVIGARRIVAVSDEHVAPLYLDRLGADASVVLPPGERTKSWEGYRRLCEELLALGIDRRTVLVVLGGGVIGDLAGFAAATLLRGIDFVQIPTTLVAQVDISVGGKTAIDTAAGQNLVGAIHQPVLVLADMDVLASLPPRELRAGYAEIVKYGLIRHPGFFEWLERHGAALLAGDAESRRHAVVESCKAKAAVVAADERETGERALLNFGHTFGHALEAELGFSDALLHGEAVSVGMAQAFDFSVRLGLCSGQDAARARAHLDALGLPTRAPAGLDPARIVGHMKKDKKASGGRLAFILTRGIGEAFIARDVPEAEVLAFMEGERGK